MSKASRAVVYYKQKWKTITIVVRQNIPLRYKLNLGHLLFLRQEVHSTLTRNY